MSNWDDLSAALEGVQLSQEAGEWAVTAMACVAYADGSLEHREVKQAKALVARTAVISDSLGPAFGEQLFMDIIERIRPDPETELAALMEHLKTLAAAIWKQEDKDAAFQTLLVIATADQQIEVNEYKMMLELKEIIGSNVMVPMPHLSV